MSQSQQSAFSCNHMVERDGFWKTTLNGWKWSKSGGGWGEVTVQRKKSQLLFFFSCLVAFLERSLACKTSNTEPVFVWVSLKNSIHNHVIPFLRVEKKIKKCPIPWYRHQRSVSASFLKVLLRHVQRPHPPSTHQSLMRLRASNGALTQPCSRNDEMSSVPCTCLPLPLGISTHLTQLLFDRWDSEGQIPPESDSSAPSATPTLL